MEVKEMVRKGQNINAQVYKGQVIVIPGGGGGGISPEAIKEAVDEYLEANPPAQGAPGKDGADGKDGKDGYTPVKGVDYFTPAEVEEIAAQAAEMVEVPETLPNPNALSFTGAVEGSYDGSKPLSIEIPQGGGEEWKRLFRTEVTESVEHIIISQDEDGNPFKGTDFLVRIKAVKREAVGGIKICESFYNSSGFYPAIARVIGMINKLGNTGGDRYYTIQMEQQGDFRKTFVSESNADILTPTDNAYATAADVYKSGVTYNVSKIVFPVSDIFLWATVYPFAVGDIVEVWYK